MTRDERTGYLLALAGNALVSTNFITAKHGLSGFDPVSFSVIWTAAAAVYTLAFLAATRRLADLALPPRAWKRVLALGAATAAGMGFGWAGLARLDPSFSALLWRFAPVITIGIGVAFLKERLAAGEVAAIAVMVGGGVLSIRGQWEAVAAGTALTFLACLTNSIQLISAKAEVALVHPNALVFYRVGIAAVLLAAWALASGGMDLDAPADCWAATLLGGLLGPCLSFLLTFRSYRYLDLARASFVATLQPVWVLLLGWLFLGRFPSARETAGGLVILAGALLMAWIQMRRSPHQVPPPLEAGE